MMRKISFLKLSFLISVLVFSFDLAQAQTTAFTYQGKLTDGAAPANGQYDFTFRLFSAVSGGAQTGADVILQDVQVTNGVFTVNLNFGASPFTSATGNFLEILVRPGAATGAYTPLTPRLQIGNAPYSIKSLNADQLGGMAANQFLTTTAAETSFIQNTTSQQAASNFNISGNGTIGGILGANIVNATTQFNLGGNRILSNAGSENLFAGTGAGVSNTTGFENAFFGRFAGQGNNTGGGNSFFGFITGRFNSSGANNSFFGSRVGFNNSTGNFNSFFGHRTGESNNGSVNSFFGTGAGLLNVSGNSNTFIGHDAGNSNLSGSFNTILGENSDVGAGNLINATAIGSKALVTQSNSLVLGSIFGVNDCTAVNNCTSINVGIGTTAPTARFHVTGTGIIRARINSDSNAGFVLALNEQSQWSLATVSPGNFQLFNDRTGQQALWVSTFDNSLNVGALNVAGIAALSSLGNAGATTLCRNASNQISICSSSIRYKTNINDFRAGLDLIRRLRPVSFNWKIDNTEDLGLVAEETAEIEPLLVTRNEKGEVEGVKYDRLGVIAINAIGEQQTQIERQQRQIEEQNVLIKQQAERLELQRTEIERQKAGLEALKKLVCLQNPAADICQSKN